MSGVESLAFSNSYRMKALFRKQDPGVARDLSISREEMLKSWEIDYSRKNQSSID